MSQRSNEPVVEVEQVPESPEQPVEQAEPVQGPPLEQVVDESAYPDRPYSEALTEEHRAVLAEAGQLPEG